MAIPSKQVILETHISYNTNAIRTAVPLPEMGVHISKIQISASMDVLLMLLYCCFVLDYECIPITSLLIQPRNKVIRVAKAINQNKRDWAEFTLEHKRILHGGALQNILSISSDSPESLSTICQSVLVVALHHMANVLAIHNIIFASAIQVEPNSPGSIRIANNAISGRNFS